jgi:hypothetical protein
MTKHTTRLSTVVAALAVVVLLAVVSFAQPKGATVTIKGEAVDLWCYLGGGDRGPAKHVREPNQSFTDWTRLIRPGSGRLEGS